MKKKDLSIVIVLLLLFIMYQLIDIFFPLTILDYSQVVNGILSPILGVITIYLIYRTWQETKTTNKEVKVSNEIFREQAYMELLLKEIEFLERDINFFTINDHQGIRAFENVTMNSLIYRDPAIDRAFVIILKMVVQLGERINKLNNDCPNSKMESTDFIKLKYSRFLNKYVRCFIEGWRKDFEDHMVKLRHNDSNTQDNELRLNLIYKLNDICSRQGEL